MSGNIGDSAGQAEALRRRSAFQTFAAALLQVSTFVPGTMELGHIQSHRLGTAKVAVTFKSFCKTLAGRHFAAHVNFFELYVLET